jgi:hypothetical protein
MRRGPKIASVVLLLFGALTTPAQNQSLGKTHPLPRVSVDSFTHDFGEVDSGTPLKFEFKIRNTGDADLLIQSVTPG